MRTHISDEQNIFVDHSKNTASKMNTSVYLLEFVVMMYLMLSPKKEGTPTLQFLSVAKT